MASQGLTRPLGDAHDVVRHLVGLQAQDDWVAGYAVRPRASSDVDAAKLADDKRLVCTWVMRGTLHLVTVADAAWLVGLLGPRFIAKMRGRRHQLGLTDAMLAEALPIIRDLVPADRGAIAEAVRRNGIDLPEGQAEAHLISVAAMSGLIHRTPDGYAPLPPGDHPEDPLAELAIRYLAGHSPATPEDFAAWSGLPLTEARKAFPSIESEEPPALPGVRLLGHWDPLLLGYRDRSFTLDPDHAKHIQRGGGFLQPLIVADGKVIGSWTRERRKDRTIIKPESFGPKLPDLDAEVADMARFFGTPTALG